MACVYRHFDRTGKLLYIGCCQCYIGRLAAHRNNSAWWNRVTKVTIQHFKSRDEAKRAEAEAIRIERPIINIQHNFEHRTLRARRLAKILTLKRSILKRLEKGKRFYVDNGDGRKIVLNLAREVGIQIITRRTSDNNFIVLFKNNL